MTTPLDHDRRLDQHLRRTLAAVAATVQEGPAGHAVSVPRRLPRRRRLLIGVGVTTAALPLAAAAVVRLGPEYVDSMPPANPIVSGSLDEERYWVVDGREMPQCQGFPSGVEVIAEEHNVVGQEWDTIGAFFGEPTRNGCAPQLADDPPEYTYYSDGGLRVGGGMLWIGALHPDVDQVRISLERGEPFNAETFEHEGAAYYVLEVPPGTATFSVEYLVDGEVVVPPTRDGDEVVVPAD